jgi:hypothetical protein
MQTGENARDLSTKENNTLTISYYLEHMTELTQQFHNPHAEAQLSSSTRTSVLLDPSLNQGRILVSKDDWHLS